MLDIVKAMKLSNRLQFIYENLLPGQPVWDFCCDHGYLGVEALKSARFPQVSFVDQVPHIVKQVESVVNEKFSEHRARTAFYSEKGEGIADPVYGNVVVAGVGAFAICKILRSLSARQVLLAQRLILCPQRDEEKFLTMLQELVDGFTVHYSMIGATLVDERARSRIVYVFDRTKALEIK